MHPLRAVSPRPILLRTCEINGLKAGYVDLERRQIRVREAIVDGRQTTLKHPRARRDIPLSARIPVKGNRIPRDGRGCRHYGGQWLEPVG